MSGTVEASEFNGWQIVALSGDIGEPAAADLRSLIYGYITTTRLWRC